MKRKIQTNQREEHTTEYLSNTPKSVKVMGSGLRWRPTGFLYSPAPTDTPNLQVHMETS